MNFDKIIDKHNQEYASGGLMYVHEVEDAMREACEMVLDEAFLRIDNLQVIEAEFIQQKTQGRHFSGTRVKKDCVDKEIVKDEILQIKEELQ